MDAHSGCLFMSKIVLLVKAVGQFKNSGKYFLLNGRWRSINPKKKVPKGSPVSDTKKLVGAFVPKQHFSDDEWGKLKLPDTNTNAKSFNGQLDKLKGYSDAGDVTAILGSQYGTNTYGKKLATIANHLLGLYGSEHKVTPGQKAGTHAALGGDAPAAVPQTPVEAKPAPASEPAATPSPGMPQFAEGKNTTTVKAYYEKVAQKVLDMAAAGDVAGIQKLKETGLLPNAKGKVGNTWKGTTANSKKLLFLYNSLVGSDAEKPAKKRKVMVSKKVEAKQHTQHKLPDIDAVVSLMPQGLTANNGGAVAQQILTAYKNDDLKSLNNIKENLFTPSDISGKALYVGKSKKAMEAFLDASIAHLDAVSKASKPAAQSTGPDFDAQLLPDSNTNSKSHNGKVAQIKAMFEAGDVAGLEAYKAGKNTYGKKQMQLAADAAAALSASQQAPVAGPEPKPRPASVAPETGPKDGDTKPGADGMLVFKNGRWHKQDTDQPVEQEPAPAPDNPIDAVPLPDLSGLPEKHQKLVTGALAKLKDDAHQNGAAAFKGTIKNMKATGKTILTLQGANGPLKVHVYGDHSKTWPIKEYVEQLKVAAGGAKTKAAKKPAAVFDANGIEAIDNWKQTGEQGGSNPGGRFKDSSGTEWYCKFPDNEDHAKAEILSASLYAAAGFSAQEAKLITKDGRIGIASKWTDLTKGSPADLAALEGAQAGMAVDAWLGNWDVVGMAFDNLQIGPDGKAHRVDAGGSLMFRAQGGKKSFGEQVVEIDTLRDKSINPQAAAVFGSMTKADITASVAKVTAIPDAAIRNLVMMHGPGSDADKKALAETLIARKQDLVTKYPKAAKKPKKRLDPKNLPVKPDRLPKRHDFKNWNGPSKGLSSLPHINEANAATESSLFELAQSGNLVALKDFKFPAVDKDTGQPTGEMLPVSQHPSKHIVQYHIDLVQVLDEIANPPEPLKVFKETDVGTIEQLSASLPPKPLGTTIGAVKSNEKLGYWVVLGTVHGAEKFSPKKTSNYTASAIQAGFDKYKQVSPGAKVFINAVQDNSSFNNLFRHGEKTYKNHSLSKLSEAALEHATTQPEGTTIYGWKNMTNDMVSKILAAPDGSVFQDTGPCCYSYSESDTSGFGKHRVKVRYAKGAKAVDSFGSGRFKGEKEVTTLPNSRFVILKKEMVPDVEHGNPSGQRLELEVLMLPPDLGIV